MNVTHIIDGITTAMESPDCAPLVYMQTGTLSVLRLLWYGFVFALIVKTWGVVLNYSFEFAIKKFKQWREKYGNNKKNQ